MAKDPAFNFYTNDFDAKTKFFSHEQVGMYLRLLMAQHQHGHLSEKQMLYICGRYDEDVFCKFSRDKDGFYFNERLEFEIDKRRSYSESRKKNRKSKKSSNISNTYDEHMSQHMENENENENDIKEKKEPISKNDLFEQIFTDERFVTDLSITHKDKDLKQAFEECYTHHSNAPNPPDFLWQWKQKLNTWLTNKRKEDGNSKIKQQSNTSALKADFIKRNFASNTGG